ncbi:hypothetical protein HNR59_000766 [Aquamicrobium lusatiense]|uniref:SH3b domain-containing protein n=1 Tax=Aquamicrobium lusatiense TaxID=89772 RepID=A0A7W9RZM1_9HYPH|nr:SH3 domain-containing protein [Aquamicrobium lusatiense]MBB6011421.1 hypothetical protein [Aquamicrobium lusatiense]
MRGLPVFGKPRRQRSVQYGYSAPPSGWHQIKEHSHLVIAGIGSLVFIAIAVTAFWFTLPRADKPVLARAAPQEIAPEAAPVTAQNPAAPDPAPLAPVAVADTAPEPEIQPLALMPEPKVPEIDQQAAAAIIVPDAGQEPATPPESESTGTQTAAIPATRPSPPAQKAAAQKTAAGNGRIIRGVTFRAGPGGDAIGTIPGGTEVKVISCDSWCEIIHKDQRGFIYKDFLDRD